MSSVREAWTDERLDDLNDRVTELGRRMDEGFAEIRTELRDLRRDMDAKIDTKIDGLQRLILQVAGGMVATFLVGFLGVIVALVQMG